MKKLKLKEQYKGTIVSRNHNLIGRVTFDTNTVSEDKYLNFYNLGFDQMFDEIEEVKPAPKKKVTKKVEEGEEKPVYNFQKKKKTTVKKDEPGTDK